MTDQSTHQGGKLNSIEQQVREAIGDAPDVMKLALEQLLQERDPDQDAQAGQAGRIGAQFGSVSELTAIAELTPDGAARLRRLFKLVHGNFTAASKVGTVHDMRFVFLDNDTRLLFATTYDGDWDAYIDDFATKIPDLMDLFFSSVKGWPGIKDPSVKDFIASLQIQASGWYVAFPHLTVADTGRMVKNQHALDEFLDKIG